MSSDRRTGEQTIPADFPAAPLTLEGYSILHQLFRVRRSAWRALDDAAREALLNDAAKLFDEMSRREDGETALFSALGHKGDLMLVHFRRGFDQLKDAELAVARLALSDYLEPATSYLSVIEIGLYEATVALYQKLIEKGIGPRSPEWKAEIDAELVRQREKISPRLFPRIPNRPYLCFYPMDKKRDGADNWYRLPIAKRQHLMHEHGMVGRRFAGEVTQIISGSIGFDDWEWGVDLFADDPIVFKKLVYEMRFDEASASYAKFGPFYVGLRIDPARLSEIFAV
ncbi:MAG: heme-dependent peroxidase [Candidatus Binatus sp.]|uniref:hydrogen peroxide-dependent heme synthase n=1 Tax=Candidatus Binatus sp. TaxID=2811406 RepID=UPI00271C7294|nr:hydrogen peroxide-dependent heme synthase [Candidatus Binatus sp.]MDO8431499.1 heme-dependent peroxidase [Candidatus Binatus sp.]